MNKINLNKNMEINGEIYQKKLNELIKKIFASAEANDVMNDAESLYSFINAKWNGLEFFKKFDEMINALFIGRVMKEKSYVDGFLKRYLNIYFELLKTDFYSSWGLVFSKILMLKDIEIFPSVFPYLFKLIFPRLPKIFVDDELLFPIEDGTSLYEIINSWLPLIEDQTLYSSSYDLFTNPKLRNELILHLYNKYKAEKKLFIWFPFSGIGVEPLLLSYLLHLLSEADCGTNDMPNFFIHCSDHFPYIIEKSLASVLFDEMLLRAKEDFCRENGMKPGEIRTTFKQVKRKLAFLPADLIYKLEVPDVKFDVVIINSLKLADHENNSAKLQKILDRLERSGAELEVVYEVMSNEPFYIESLSPANHYEKKIISESFVSLKTDRNSALISLLIRRRPEKESGQLESIHELFVSSPAIDREELKNRLMKIKLDEIDAPADKLKYAELLAISGYYTRSYDIIKKYCRYSYKMSHDVLQIILSGSRNEKLNARIENFIIENKIREKGFAGELIDAISEELEEYFYSNPDTLLKKEKWII